MWIALLCASCGGGGGGGGASSTPPVSPNQLPVALLPGNLNTPVVSVTVCIPGTSTCQTIGNILLDTGSVGLRLSHSALAISLPQKTWGGLPLYECMKFGTGDNFGPVALADVDLGGEPRISSVTVQISHSESSAGFSIPSACPLLSPFQNSGFNGVLGVGYPFVQYDNQTYYACAGSGGCPSGESSVSLPQSQMVANPVFLLPTDNNGVILTLPAIPAAGVTSLSGTLTLGVNTQADNQTSGLTALTVDLAGSSCDQQPELSASAGSTGVTCGLLDSGSNGLFFGTSSYPLCSGQSWYCPSSAPASLSLLLTGNNGLSVTTVLSIVGLNSQSASIGLDNLAGPESGTSSSGVFDAGLPFFFGRSVAVGYATSGQTPFWAF